MSTPRRFVRMPMALHRAVLPHISSNGFKVLYYLAAVLDEREMDELTDRSIADLAEGTGLAKASVQSAVVELRQRGLLLTSTGSGPGAPRRYRVCLDEEHLPATYRGADPEARAVVQEAHASGRPVEVLLDPEERADEYRARYRLAAEALGLEVEIVGESPRPYRTHIGHVAHEPSLLRLTVRPRGRGRPARKPPAARRTAGADAPA